MTTSKYWLEADKQGLAKQAKERGGPSVVVELVSNALDERFSGMTQIDITAEPVPNRPLVRIVVEDNSPRGYGEYLPHAYTLFAESYKRTNPEQSGQFNFGCKLWLALCKFAIIETTSGTIEFNENGRLQRRRKRESGTKVEGVMEMTRQEMNELCDVVHSLLLPEGIRVTFNGEPIECRAPVHAFKVKLPTKIVNDDGVMVATARKTTVSLYDPKDAEKPMIYELGIPVVETDIRWHIRVGQKILLNKDRDNVTPAYHRSLCTSVAEEMRHSLNEDDANTWGRIALADPLSSKGLREKLVTERFGPKPAALDPNDPESRIRWQTEHGGTLVHGSMMSASEWQAVKEYDLIPSTGRLAPTAKPWSDDPRAIPADFIPHEDWTVGMRQVAHYAKWVALHALNLNGLKVAFAKQMNNARVAACYAPSRLEFNMQSLGQEWFADGVTDKVDELLIHEFAHHFVASHCDKQPCHEVPSGMFHDACCVVGARLKQLALREPRMFREFNRSAQVR